MCSSAIDEAYERLLHTADKEVDKYLKEAYKANPDTMTDQDIALASDTLADIRKDSKELELLAGLPSSNGKLERDPSEVTDEEKAEEKKTVTAKIEIDHNTGKTNILSAGDVAKDDHDAMSMEDFLDNITVPEHTIEDISAHINDQFKISIEDSMALAKLCKEYKANPKMTGVFAKLPKSIKGYIYKQIMEMADGAMGNYDKNLKNMMAESLLISINEDMDVDAYQAEFDDMMNTMYKENAGELGDLYTEMIEKKIDSIYDMATRLSTRAEKEDDFEMKKKLLEKAGILGKMGFMMTQATCLDTFYEAIKDHTIKKIRKIDMEQYEKIFRKFNAKYNGVEDFTINNIAQCPAILNRHLHKDYTNDDIIRFLLFFCKFTENMNPKDPVDHTYMYYVIKNITALDTIVFAKEEQYPRSHKFYNDFLKAISNCIDAINTTYVAQNR